MHEQALTGREAIPWAKPVFGGREREYVLDALESTWISGGPYVDRLEREFTARNGARLGLAVSNGTTALQLAFLALGIGPGDEVIVPGFTFVAPGNMVLAVGATPVFVDIDPATWGVDVGAVEAAITPRTKAIVAVHVYGNACDMDPLLALASRHKIAVVEDAAESMLTTYGGRCVGTLGDIGCFSFQATKTLTTGEGGFVVTGRQDLFESMRVIRDHGMRRGKRYWHDAVGFNFRLTNLQAALGCAQLERADEVVRLRAEMHRRYSELLSAVPGVTLQRFDPKVVPVVWAVAAKIDARRFKGDRDTLIERLAEAGIETRPGFYPFSAMPLYKAPRLPVSEEVGRSVISFPSFPSLTSEQIARVCRALKGLAAGT